MAGSSSAHSNLPTHLHFTSSLQLLLCHCSLLKISQRCTLSLPTKMSVQNQFWGKKSTLHIEKKYLFQAAMEVEAELPIPACHCQNVHRLCPMGSMASCRASATCRTLLLAHSKLGTWDRRQKDGDGKKVG